MIELLGAIAAILATLVPVWVKSLQDRAAQKEARNVVIDKSLGGGDYDDLTSLTSRMFDEAKHTVDSRRKTT